MLVINHHRHQKKRSILDHLPSWLVSFLFLVLSLGLDGVTAVRAMLLLDEIRGRLAEVFPLNKYKIDHVVHGAIASACVYGALMEATAEQIEHAIGMVVAHYIPWRAIRAGKQLSDSKGASAAIRFVNRWSSNCTSPTGMQYLRRLFSLFSPFLLSLQYGGGDSFGESSHQRIYWTEGYLP